MDDDAELKSPVTDVEHAFATVAETDVHEHEALGHEPAPQDPVEEVQVHPMPSNDAAHLAEGGSAGSPKVAKVVQKPPATKTAGTRTIRSPISDKVCVVCLRGCFHSTKAMCSGALQSQPLPAGLPLLLP